MKLDHTDTLALLDRLLESEPKTDRPGGFTVRLRRLRDLVAESQSAELKLSTFHAHVFPGVSKNSLRTTMMEFRKSLAQAVESAGLRFELIRPDARGAEADEVICSFEGEALPLIFNNADAEIALGREIEVIEPRARATRVFVSFAIADRKLATEFTEQLKVNLPLRCAEPVNLWRFDEKGGILPGEDNEAEIRKRMNESQFGILLISPVYLDRPFIQRVELPHFLGPTARAHPIPVAMADFIPGSDRHPLLDPTNVFQYKGKSFAKTDKKDRGEFVKALCGHIADLIAKYPPPPVPKAAAIREAENLILRTGHEGTFPEDCEYIQPKGRAEHSLAKSAASSPDNSTEGSVPVLEALEQWVNNPKDSAYMALLGESGSGKTMTCSKLSQSLNAKRPGSSIYIDLRYLNESGLLKRNPNPKLEDILAASLSRSADPAVTPKRVLDCVREKGALLIWDGLDEVLVHLSAQEGEAIFSQLKEALPPRVLKEGKGKAGRLLVACRTQYFRTVEHEASTLTQSQRGPVNASAPDQLRSRFRVLRLLPFDDDQIRAYLEANVPGLDVERAFDLIQKIHNLHDLAQRPYCLSLLRASLPDLDRLLAEGKRVRPVDLYKSLVRSWLARDSTKHRFEEDDKPKLMARLAAWMWREGARSMTAERLGAWLKETVFADPLLRSIYGDDFKDAKKRDELLQDFRTATFIARWDGDTFRFAHTSLQEYFLAEHLVDQLETGAIDGWLLPRVNRETLDFTAEIFIKRGEEGEAVRKRIEDSLRLLLAESVSGRSENALAFYIRLHVGGESAFQTEKLDCRNLDLSAWEFQGSTGRPLLLAGADFSASVLIRASFREVDLSHSRWTGADLRSTEFLGCGLEEVDFSSSGGSSPLLGGVRLRKCRLYSSLPPSKFPPGLRIDLPQWDLDTQMSWRAVGTEVGVASQSPVSPLWPSPPAEDLPGISWSLGHTLPVTGIAFSPDGSTIVSASYDYTVRCWDLASGQCTRILEGHSEWAAGAAFSPEGSTIASASYDGTVRLWDADSGRCIRILEGHSSPVTNVAFSPDGSAVASVSYDGTIRLWDANSGRSTRILEGHSSPITGVAFSPDGFAIASASDDNTVRVWDANSGKCIHILRGHSIWVTGVAFSPDGSVIASASFDNTIRLWHARTGQCFRILEGHSSQVTGVAFSPDGSIIASASTDNTIRLWHARTGQCFRILEEHSNWATAVAFSPDGSIIASASDDNTIRIWDAISGRCIRVIQGHPNCVEFVASSPDGSTIASVSDGSTLRIWDAISGRCTAITRKHSNRPKFVAFLPDGSAIATASDDDSTFLWDARTGKLLEILDGWPETSGKPSIGTLSSLGTILVSTDDGRDLDIAALPDGGYAVLEKAPGETRWRLARAKGEYWRYVNYVSDTRPDGTPGRVLYSADVLGEVPEL